MMPGGHQQGAEQGEFAGAELNGLIPQGHLAQQDMHLERTDADPLLQTRATAAQQQATAGGQFLQAKGLAQDVIGAGIEQGDHRF